MKVVIAIDSFKGSMTSLQAGNAVKEGILRAVPTADVVVRPLADGGEGTVDALVDGLGGEKLTARVKGPLGEPVECAYGILPDKGLSIMEMAGCCGLTLIPPEQRNPLHTTTYGLGELIRHAMDRGCRDFLIGIGGSATNDAGIGMLAALGFRFYTQNGESAGITGGALKTAERIDVSKADPRLSECRFRIACDVNNPLYGPQGAAYVYAPQKGATPEIVKELDEGLSHFAAVCSRALSAEFHHAPGAGAAGGLGYAFAAFLNADLTPGVELVLDAIQLEEDLKDADYAVTGEGRMDFQTAMGKAPIGVASLAKRHGVVAIAFAGATADDAAEVNNHGIDAYFAIPQGPLTLNEAMEFTRATKNLSSRAEQVFRVIGVCKRP